MLSVIHKSDVAESNMAGPAPEVKRVSFGSPVIRDREDRPAEGSAQVPDAPLSKEEARAKRRAEFRDVAAAREKALRMQRQAEDRLKQTEQFGSLLEQAKDDPTVLAKALNMDPYEFQRKIFNKSFSIKEDPEPKKEETFEEQMNRRLAQYEAEMNRDREERAAEARQNMEMRAQKTKHDYIMNQIMPHISEDHEFIIKNDKYSCAAMIYDMMNSLFQEHCNKGGTEANFNANAKNFVDQLEEDFGAHYERQFSEVKSIKKLKKYFSDSDYDNEVSEMPETEFRRKSFSNHSFKKPSPTLSGSSIATPSAPQSLTVSSSGNRSNISRREDRLYRAQKMLGAE